MAGDGTELESSPGYEDAAGEYDDDDRIIPYVKKVGDPDDPGENAPVNELGEDAPAAEDEPAADTELKQITYRESENGLVVDRLDEDTGERIEVPIEDTLAEPFRTAFLDMQAGGATQWMAAAPDHDANGMTASVRLRLEEGANGSPVLRMRLVLTEPPEGNTFTTEIRKGADGYERKDPVTDEWIPYDQGMVGDWKEAYDTMIAADADVIRVRRPDLDSEEGEAYDQISFTDGAATFETIFVPAASIEEPDVTLDDSYETDDDSPEEAAFSPYGVYATQPAAIDLPAAPKITLTPVERPLASEPVVALTEPILAPPQTPPAPIEAVKPIPTEIGWTPRPIELAVLSEPTRLPQKISQEQPTSFLSEPTFLGEYKITPALNAEPIMPAALPETPSFLAAPELRPIEIPKAAAPAEIPRIQTAAPVAPTAQRLESTPQPQSAPAPDAPKSIATEATRTAVTRVEPALVKLAFEPPKVKPIELVLQSTINESPPVRPPVAETAKLSVPSTSKNFESIILTNTSTPESKPTPEQAPAPEHAPFTEPAPLNITEPAATKPVPRAITPKAPNTPTGGGTLQASERTAQIIDVATTPRIAEQSVVAHLDRPRPTVTEVVSARPLTAPQAENSAPARLQQEVAQPSVASEIAPAANIDAAAVVQKITAPQAKPTHIPEITAPAAKIQPLEIQQTVEPTQVIRSGSISKPKPEGNLNVVRTEISKTQLQDAAKPATINLELATPVIARNEKPAVAKIDSNMESLSPDTAEDMPDESAQAQKIIVAAATKIQIPTAAETVTFQSHETATTFQTQNENPFVETAESTISVQQSVEKPTIEKTTRTEPAQVQVATHSEPRIIQSHEISNLLNTQAETNKPVATTSPVANSQPVALIRGTQASITAEIPIPEGADTADPIVHNKPITPNQAAIPPKAVVQSVSSLINIASEPVAKQTVIEPRAAQQERTILSTESKHSAIAAEAKSATPIYEAPQEQQAAPVQEVEKNAINEPQSRPEAKIPALDTWASDFGSSAAAETDDDWRQAFSARSASATEKLASPAANYALIQDEDDTDAIVLTFDPGKARTRSRAARRSGTVAA